MGQDLYISYSYLILKKKKKKKKKERRNNLPKVPHLLIGRDHPLSTEHCGLPRLRIRKAMIPGAEETKLYSQRSGVNVRIEKYKNTEE